MIAWLPQASYPCGNFSDTPNLIIKGVFPYTFLYFPSRKSFSLLCKYKSQGSLGHHFRVNNSTEFINQINLYPYVHHEVSVLIDFIFGNLRYLVTDVPPQQNSPSISFFHLFLSKIKDSLVPTYNEMSEIVLQVVVFHV